MPSLISAVLTLILLAPVTLAAGRELAPRPFGPTAYWSGIPLVAHAGGKYLTVWTENLGRAGWRHLGAFSDSDGKKISPTAFVVVPYGIGSATRLIGTGTSFALFVPRDEGAQMFDIDLAGHVTSMRVIPIAGFAGDPAVAWSGSHFIAVEHSGGVSRAVVFDRGGTITREVTLPCLAQHHELLAVRSDFIVASVCGGAVRADRIASDDSITTTILDPSVTNLGIDAVAAPAADGKILMAWSSPDFEWSLQTSIISADGTASAPRTVAQNGQRLAFDPMLLTQTTGGFLLAHLEHSNLRVAKLDADGGLIETNPGLSNSVGFPVNAGTDGRKMLVTDVYTDSPVAPGHVRTRFVDAAGQIGAGEYLSIVPARQYAPVIGAGSGTLVAVWTEVVGPTSFVKAAHVTAGGTSITNGVIESSAALATSDLAWNGAEYLTVISRNNQLYAQRINAFGERSGNPTLLANVPSQLTAHVAVVWAGNRWEAVWSDYTSAYHAEIAPDGTLATLELLRVEGSLRDAETYRTGIYDLALAFDGEQVYVAWIEGQSFPCHFECIEARPAFVTTIERHGANPGLPIRISDPWDLSISLSLAANDGDVVALANQYQRPTVVTSVGSNLTAIATRTLEGVGDVTWDGGAFVVALREPTRLTLHRVDANLVDAATPRVSRIGPADLEESAPSVAVAISGNAIVGIQEVDGTRGARATVHAEQELGSATPRRRRVRR